QAFQPDIIIDSAFDMQKIGIQGQILPVPGHTPGSLVTVIGNSAFVGDLIRGGIINNNEPAAHFIMCDLVGNQRDIDKLLQLENIRYWYPGHFGPLNTEAVKKFNVT